jgi:S-adenosylmethionine-diacylglycerol 3-amino-3-carboxypropyl transferase
MANEDTRLEYEMTKIVRPKKVVSVCGSGARALPLICYGAEELYCVDLSQEQLWLLELRVSAIKKMNHTEYLKFWGYSPFFQDRYTEERQALFESLDLSIDCRNYFFKHFLENRFCSLLYAGKWEKTFITFSKIIKKTIGEHSHNIFQFNNLDEQIAYLNTEFPWLRWKAILHGIGNRSIFNALLYKGHFVNKNIPESYFDFYHEAFKRLFFSDLAKKSFFLQLCLLGEIIYPEGNLVEADAECFNLMKEKLLNPSFKIHFIQNDLIHTIKSLSHIDFISLSDVPSYFSGETEKQFLQTIRPNLSQNSLTVLRSYLRVPNAERQGFIDKAGDYAHLIQQEKVQMYKIEVLKNV